MTQGKSSDLQSTDREVVALTPFFVFLQLRAELRIRDMEG
jgi:hypothetical protein